MTPPFSALFLLGPSGVGKSHLAAYLEREHGWLHLEIDQMGQDGIDLYDLRMEWDAFYLHKQPATLIETFKKRAHNRSGCVLTFPSMVIMDSEHIRCGLGSICIRYMDGPMSLCLLAFRQRERETGRNLADAHWAFYNRKIFRVLSHRAIRPHRVAAFTPDGCRRTPDDIWKQIATFCSSTSV
ncbi:MAG: ATP-binding protein [candidate division Zixibacteria bacterium]|nr:ATP-binding protein [candidate division Zixibacteria bacterium]